MVNLNRRRFLQMSALAGAGYLGGIRSARCENTTASTTKKPLNVLFIAIDDLRPQLGCYGLPQMKTPALDALAGQGVVFDRAYCQQAICSASRSSLLTGCRPDTTGVYDLKTHFRSNIPEVVTLPQCFKQQGYYTKSLGKIYHPGYDDPPSWSEPAWWPDRTLGLTADPEAVKQETAKGGKSKNKQRGPSWEASALEDSVLPDGQTADKAINALQTLKEKEMPFFLAVGFLKPHLPFVAPQKYYDLYPPDSVRTTDSPNVPTDVPEVALTQFGELRNYADIPKTGPIPEEKARELVRGYYAATSYMDAQVGRVLAELDRLGLRENTVIIAWGDHGWHLGDNGQWCKHTNFERATRSALIMSAPGGKAKNAHSQALVEFVDIYPTLCALCGLNPPDTLEGASFASLLDHPETVVKTAAFSQYPRSHNVMGYSMRTDRYRFTEWLDKDRKRIARELYDHQEDPDENHNLAGREAMREIVETLSVQMQAGWRGAVVEK